jgi:hypothetical protein
VPLSLSLSVTLSLFSACSCGVVDQAADVPCEGVEVGERPLLHSTVVPDLQRRKREERDHDGRGEE